MEIGSIWVKNIHCTLFEPIVRVVIHLYNSQKNGDMIPGQVMSIKISRTVGIGNQVS